MTCINPNSIINENWNPEYEPSIYIELLDYYDTIYDGKKFCFRKDELTSIINIDNYQTAKWFMDPIYEEFGYEFDDAGWVIFPSNPEQKYAFGYPSEIETYIRIPIDEGLEFYVLQQNLETILLTDTKDYIGIVIDQTRIGKDYTMSGLHGQLPEVQIYYLVPRTAYEHSLDVVTNEIYNVLYTIKHSTLLHPTLQDIQNIQNYMPSDIDAKSLGANQSTNSSHQTPIGSPRSPIRSPRSSMGSSRSSIGSPLSSIGSPRSSIGSSRSSIGSPRSSIGSPISPLGSPISPIRSNRSQVGPPQLPMRSNRSPVRSRNPPVRVLFPRLYVPDIESSENLSPEIGDGSDSEGF